MSTANNAYICLLKQIKMNILKQIKKMKHGKHLS